jgi:flagellar biosynthesis protein FliR
VGLPISLVFGLVIVIVGLPAVQTNFVQSFDTALQLMRGLLDSAP